jgi:hypothetical protein
MTSRQFVQEKTMLGDYLMRYSIGGDAAFHILAFHYASFYADKVSKIPTVIIRKWELDHNRIEHDSTLLQLLDTIVVDDPMGVKLPEWYQFFIGRRFREGSGKFFTPKPIARAMAQMLPIVDQAVIMDPSCGGGTFLVEASNIWRSYECTLIANDVETSLVDLATIAMILGAPRHHFKYFSTDNIFDDSKAMSSWNDKVDYILANPPFSLRVDLEQSNSKLYSKGYWNSDAIFIDTALKLLKPKGRLVCLLPHSLIANSDFADFRKIVEEFWYILAVICLPEGVFQLSAGTTTRADIVVLEKKQRIRIERDADIVFASVPSVGIRLNNNDKAEVSNDLEKLINDSAVRSALQI